MTSTSETLPPTAETPISEAAAVFESVTPARRLPRVRVMFAAFVAGLAVTLGVSAAGLYAYDSSHGGHIVHGVRIGNVDVSDLDRVTAAARLHDGLTSFGQGSVVISDGVVRDTIAFSDLGRGPAIDALLDQAFAVGRTGTVVDRGIDEVRTAARGVTIAPSAVVDSDAIAAAVASLAARQDRLPVDATAGKTATGFTTTASRPGRKVDQAAMTAAIAAALTRADAPAEVDLDLIATPIAPAVDDTTANVARATAAAMSQDLSIVNDNDTWTIAGATIKSWISFGMVGGRYQPVIDPSGIKMALQPLVKAVVRTAKDAKFLVGKGGKIAGVTAGVVGRALDLPGTEAAVVAALQARAGGSGSVSGPVAAVVMTTDPALTTAVAVQSAPLMRQISTWVTYYIPGPHNGNAANITIPAMAISGTIVAPGQTFSFWKSVGEVSLAKGYKLGGAIIGGHSVEGKTIGGGICSTSTTLFNAALRAGFQMGARKNHYYYITRYPKGLDATVFISGSTQDMTWTNDSPYPVLIKATARPGVVRFTLYSVPTGRYVTISRPIVKNYQPSTTIIQKTTTLRHGVRQQVEYEAAGFDAWVTVTVHDKTGKVLGARTYYSHYSRVVGVILVGQ